MHKSTEYLFRLARQERHQRAQCMSVSEMRDLSCVDQPGLRFIPSGLRLLRFLRMEKNIERTHSRSNPRGNDPAREVVLALEMLGRKLSRGPNTDPRSDLPDERTGRACK
jgi:hypothetical protein